MAVVIENPEIFFPVKKKAVKPPSNPIGFPWESLPPILLRKVLAEHYETQGALSSLVSAHLAALATACQGSIKIKKREGFISPTGMWTLSVESSGSGKSVKTSRAFSPIKAFQRKVDKIYCEMLSQYEADLEAWKAKRKGVLASIRNAARKGECTQAAEEQLQALECIKPNKPKRLKLMYENFTPDALLRDMSDGIPVATIVADEGGVITKGRTMSSSSEATMNVAWDGRSVIKDRMSTDRHEADEVALTMALFIQPEALAEYLSRKGAYARGIGFFARMLFAVPEDVIGTRLIDNQTTINVGVKQDWDDRITAILEAWLARGLDAPRLEMAFTQDAQAYWEATHNEIEQAMGPEGEFREVRDMAAKLSDQIARMSALFAYLEKDTQWVEINYVAKATRVCYWYAEQFIRYFAKPAQQSEANKEINATINWLQREASETGDLQVRKRKLSRNGPVRDSTTLDRILFDLMNANMIWLRRTPEGMIIELSAQYFSTALDPATNKFTSLPNPFATPLHLLV